MQTVGAYEAKTHLPKLLEQVARGEAITITKHGVPVALLTPIPHVVESNLDVDLDALSTSVSPLRSLTQRSGRLKRNQDLASVIADLRALKRETSLDGLTIRELMEEGRRF
jgi:prevent-host-death family protein